MELLEQMGLFGWKLMFSDGISKCFQRDQDSVRVEEYLQLKHLQKLMVWFQNHRPDTPQYNIRTPYSKNQRTPGYLTRQEFAEALYNVLGTNEYDRQLDTLFTKLDTSDDGYVDWNEFCTYILLQLRENDYLSTRRQRPVQIEPRIKHIVHNRQETTSKVVAVDGPLRYVSVSKEGALCIWNNNLHMEKHVLMSDGEDDPRNPKRRVKMWITDAIYLPNCRKLAITSTGRDIRFFDTTSGQYNEEFHLYGIIDVPTCLTYWYKPQNANSESILIFGDDGGALNMLTFTRPVTQLFNTPFKKVQGVQKIYMPDIHLHHKWVRHSQIEDVHKDIVRKVLYLPENSCTMSSSINARNSLVIYDVYRERKAYVFNLTRGVECFDHSKHLNSLVTGSADHMVRIWNPYVPSKATAILQGHGAGIVDVTIHQQFTMVLSYSKDTVLKIWDLKEHTCLQTVNLKFPCSNNGRVPDHGTFSLHLQPPPINSLLVTSADYVAMVKLGETGPPVTFTPTTHFTQLCAALYNPHFKQVVTGADDSSVAVWDLETGIKSMIFTQAHGGEEITCLTFDNTWKRLVTGARNGTIKIWNLQNGHNAHQLEAVDEAEVTGLVPLTERKVILAVGPSRAITIYDMSHPDTYSIQADAWKGGQVHQDDVIAVAHLPPTLLATASFDGEINVWNLETEKLYLCLRKGHAVKENGFAQSRSAQSSSSKPSSAGSRPNSRHNRYHNRSQKGSLPPVDKLLFLQARTRHVKRAEWAILVSSEAGTLRWWSIYGSTHQMGYFYAPGQVDESVLGMCSDPNNQVLVTGDTQGHLAVWNISKFCMTMQKNKVTSRPTLEHTWCGHDSAVVSVEYVQHECGLFVVSASTDCTAKLWTLDGHCVGIFGQKEGWNLRQTSTWMHPPTPQVALPEVDSSDTSAGHKSDEEDGKGSKKEKSTDCDSA